MSKHEPKCKSASQDVKMQAKMSKSISPDMPDNFKTIATQRAKEQKTDGIGEIDSCTETNRQTDRQTN